MTLNVRKIFFFRKRPTDSWWWEVDCMMPKRSRSRCYDSPKRHKNQSLIRGRLCSQVWWDFKGVLFLEILQTDSLKINLNIYYQPLDSLNKSIIPKHPEPVNCKGVTFHHKVRLQPSKIIGAWMGCVTTPTILIWPCAVRLRLFHSLQNSMCGATFNSDEVLNQHLVQLFNSKNSFLFEWGIMKRTERLQKVIEQNGQHIIDSFFFHKGPMKET